MRGSVLIWGLVWLELVVPAAGLAGATSGVPAELQAASKKEAKPASSLKVTPGIVCRTIDGFEDYEPLPDAAQTSDEKLLIYLRVSGCKIERKEGYNRAHLSAGFQIRKRGEKAVLLQKQNGMQYEPKSRQPLGEIYLKIAVSLKGLSPGEYDLSLTIHDEIAEGTPATQVVKFKVIPAQVE